MIEVPINQPVELDWLNRKEVLVLREANLKPFTDRLIDSYQPSFEVFSQIEDGRPWWGLQGIYFYGPGPQSIEGPSEERRFLLNPLLLVGLAESRTYITRLRPGSEDSYYPQPVQLVFDTAKAEARAIGSGAIFHI